MSTLYTFVSSAAQAAVVSATQRLADLDAGIAKMRAKAEEKNPDRQVPSFLQRHASHARV